MFQIEFNEKNVRLNVKAQGWEDAIRQGGQILVDNGKVHPQYIDEIISSIKEFGPYIVIADGLAIPHARPEKGAIDIGFSLITLEEPVKFDEETGQVKVMICFSAVDGNSHLEILKMIVSFVENGKIEEIARSQNIGELLELIK